MLSVSQNGEVSKAITDVYQTITKQQEDARRGEL
jgi:hypothetical protein